MLAAELWALKDVLSLAKDLDIDFLEIEIDFPVTITLLNRSSVNHLIDRLLDERRSLLISTRE